MDSIASEIMKNIIDRPLDRHLRYILADYWEDTGKVEWANNIRSNCFMGTWKGDGTYHTFSMAKWTKILGVPPQLHQKMYSFTMKDGFIDEVSFSIAYLKYLAEIVKYAPITKVTLASYSPFGQSPVTEGMLKKDWWTYHTQINSSVANMIELAFNEIGLTSRFTNERGVTDRAIFEQYYDTAQEAEKYLSNLLLGLARAELGIFDTIKQEQV